MSRDKICTQFELKEFAFNEENPTASNFAMWMEAKTRKRFTVIEKEFIRDILAILDSYATLTGKLNDDFKSFRKKWDEVIERI